MMFENKFSIAKCLRNLSSMFDGNSLDVLRNDDLVLVWNLNVNEMISYLNHHYDVFYSDHIDNRDDGHCEQVKERWILYLNLSNRSRLGSVDCPESLLETIRFSNVLIWVVLKNFVDYHQRKSIVG